MSSTKSISLLVCALGGEGGGVLSEWLMEVARHAGYAAQSTSIPGVAQRTGATTYYIEVFPQPLKELAGRRPVFSLNPVPGALDALVSSELLETARQISLGLPSPDRTLLITSSNRTLTTQERVSLADGRSDSARLLQLARSMSREHHVLDMGELARQSGTIVSAVMLGAIAGSSLFAFPRSAYEAVVGAGGAAAKASLAGFEAGFAALAQARKRTALVTDLLSGQVPAGLPRGAALPPELARQFPPVVHPLLALGFERVRDYQDAAYADLYVLRLSQVLAAERAADPADAHGCAITIEMARWLALWMAFDDIVRVADLKSRASRWARVQAEVKAQDGDLLRVYDHFKPGIAEIAGLLPAPLADRMLAWDRRRQSRGRTPWAVPLKVGTHSVIGMLALRLLVWLKFLRRRGSRFALEQALIEQWLAAVVKGAATHWQNGFELAQCGRLIKGYGSTNERGKDNLLHIVTHLARAAHFESEAARAGAIAAARNAALTDEAGVALDAALRQYGVPAREIRAQPIRWVRQRPGGNADRPA